MRVSPDVRTKTGITQIHSAAETEYSYETPRNDPISSPNKERLLYAFSICFRVSASRRRPPAARGFVRNGCGTRRGSNEPRVREIHGRHTNETAPVGPGRPRTPDGIRPRSNRPVAREGPLRRRTCGRAPPRIVRPPRARTRDAGQEPEPLRDLLDLRDARIDRIVPDGVGSRRKPRLFRDAPRVVRLYGRRRVHDRRSAGGIRSDSRSGRKPVEIDGIARPMDRPRRRGRLSVFDHRTPLGTLVELRDPDAPDGRELSTVDHRKDERRLVNDNYTSPNRNAPEL